MSLPPYTAVGEATSVVGSGSSQVALVQSPESQNTNSVPTVYYVNFNPAIQEEFQEELQQLKASVELFNTWATAQAQEVVARKIKSGQLDSNNLISIASYRAKVMDTVYRERSPWLSSSVAVNNSDTLEIRSSEFHSDIMKLALKGFPMEQPVLNALEDVILAIRESVCRGGEQEHTKGINYWIQTSWYEYDPVSKTTGVVIRTINYTTTQRTYEVVSEPKLFGSATKTRITQMKMDFTGQQSVFNKAVWDSVSKSITMALEQKGNEMAVFDPTWDVDI